MNYLDELNKIMEDSLEMALATSVNDCPNVRIVNFYYNSYKPGIAYFSTFGDNTKVVEFKQNNNVAFTTIPQSEYAHVRVNKAIVVKSKNTIHDLKNEFINKIPGYDMTIDEVGDMLELYEIHFNEAEVTIDMESSGRVNFKFDC